FFHWGIHRWGVYGIVGLVFGYFRFDKGYGGLVRGRLRRLLGEKGMGGGLGGGIDVLGVIGTVRGVGGRLGLGGLEIKEGLDFLFNVG
ncbi:BCCT family transporter, partial [Staphylococcus aureus]|uniref:BCCT family transporter n=1 Tax=Staphylococcus aureus TaxID=1280 RepID=UPI001642CCC8